MQLGMLFTRKGVLTGRMDGSGNDRPCFCGLCDDQHALTCVEFAGRGAAVVALGVVVVALLAGWHRVA